MAMFNDLYELAAGLPTSLLAAWAVWVGAGVLLMAWFRRAKLEPEPAVSTPRPVSRAKSRQSSSSVVVAQGSVLGLSSPMPSVETTDVERPRAARAVAGDPFGDLATLLDQPDTTAAAEPRALADSPILNAAGSPIHRANGGKDESSYVA